MLKNITRRTFDTLQATIRFSHQFSTSTRLPYIFQLTNVQRSVTTTKSVATSIQFIRFKSMRKKTQSGKVGNKTQITFRHNFTYRPKKFFPLIMNPIVVLEIMLIYANLY